MFCPFQIAVPSIVTFNPFVSAEAGFLKEGSRFRYVDVSPLPWMYFELYQSRSSLLQLFKLTHPLIFSDLVGPGPYGRVSS